MTPRFVFHPAARAELREARDWYDGQRSGLGRELGDVVATTLERIAAHPEAYPAVFGTLRRAVLSRFPYALFYRRRAAAPDVIEVLAVFHHRRDPATWRRRAAV
ncbi:MAG TPA: type II toxin-antitoxin system RelE/ParE family toxin [Gemmatimonadaceae bacterium]|nr:type II toxin-antitoxin system RelE/ParE family toxin [Gemmatimonadaceae bacterium]